MCEDRFWASHDRNREYFFGLVESLLWEGLQPSKEGPGFLYHRSIHLIHNTCHQQSDALQPVLVIIAELMGNDVKH